jgi:soluble cytochrome b562
MKRMLLAALAATALAGFIIAQPAPNAEKKGPETELGKSMDKLNGAFRTLRRQVADASKNAESLALVATIRTEAVAAKKEIPMKAADIPEADRAAYVTKYQKGIDDLVTLIGRLEVALKANDNAGAEKLVADMASAQKAGHDEFRKKKS